MAPTPIALIGSGIFAKEEHLPAILATPSLRLVAVYSRSLASAKTLTELLREKSEEGAGLDLYSEDQEGRGFDELLARGDVKGLIIALPILTQPSYIQRALKAGKHVLAEKPIAKDVASAKSLLDFYNSTDKKATFGIAENFRFLESFQHASELISKLGRILGFRVRVSSMVTPGGKYFETAWRKIPEYQGGFLLDGGVHSLAATRVMLSGEKMVRTSAFTTQLQEHLPPVDTLSAIVQLASGASGTIELSFGTTFSGSQYIVACENGTVSVSRGKVEVVKDGKSVVVRDDQEWSKDFPDEGNGVKQEVAAWAEGLSKGEANSRQSPEEALKDLQWLEAMLTSGENGGAPVELDL